MSKNVYSLVLDSDVIELLDRAAEKKGYSRSNYVNQILAERLNFETPEKRMKDIFGEVERLIDAHNNMRFLSQVSASSASIKSVISYRYKPTVKYSVELYVGVVNSPFLGELRVSFRTQNLRLLQDIEDFFKLWSYLEKKYVSENITSEVADGKFRRVLFKPEFFSDNVLTGEIITNYIKNLDQTLNNYFDNITNKVFFVKKLEENFKRGVAANSLGQI